MRHKKHTHESFKGNSTLGLKRPPVRPGRLHEKRERERERGEKSGGKLWDDYVTVSQNEATRRRRELKEGSMMARAVGTHFQNGLLYLQQGLRESSARTATVGDGEPGRRGRRGNAPGQFSLLMPHFSRTPPLTRSFLLLRSFGPSVRVQPTKNDDSRRRKTVFPFSPVECVRVRARARACACLHRPSTVDRATPALLTTYRARWGGAAVAA